MAEGKRMFSKGELTGAVVAALAVGFFLGSMFMELKPGANTPPAMSLQRSETPGGPAGMGDQGMGAPGDGGASREMMAQLRDLQTAAQNNPKDQGAWIDLGNAYFDAHQPQLAVGAYAKAVALGQVKPDVWTDYGTMLRESGQARKAVECFDAALRQDPVHHNALFNKGVVLLHDLNDRAGALTSWETLLQADPAAKAPDGTPLKDMVDGLRKKG